MHQQFQDKVVVITGASRGIGAILARQFAQAGACVVFGARRAEVIARQQEALRAEGLRALAVEADVAREQDCGKLIAAAVEHFGGVDVLVNNAGISGVQKPCWEVTGAELDEVMQVNVNGALACIRHAAPHMMRRGAGAIVNIGSFTGKRPALNRTVYATSKMALVGLTRTAALELAQHKVRCNVISPGPVQGERVQEVVTRAAQAQNITEDEVRSRFLAWAPLGEMVTEQEICDMVFFLASDSGRHITGQDINMDGGIVMY